MTGSSTSPDTSVDHETVPAQRNSAEGLAFEHATLGLGAVRVATERLYEEVYRLSDPEFTRPTTLPGWTRAHLVTHLARNADALVNLLTWARTGIEHPMYASKADRDADIEEGSQRLAQVIREDLLAACTRFEVAAERLTGSDWLATIAHRTGRVFPATDVVPMRLFEVWLHLVDLDVGVGFADIPETHVEQLLEVAVYPHVDRPVGRPLRIRVQLPSGAQRGWRLTIPESTGSGEVSGPAADMIAWLAGRSTGAGLTGEVPELPAWG
jgi:maleylpyruvate isomerase